MINNFIKQSLSYKAIYRAEGDISTRHAQRRTAGNDGYRGLSANAPDFRAVEDDRQYDQSSAFAIV
jgi:hypothetical protein